MSNFTLHSKYKKHEGDSFLLGIYRLNCLDVCGVECDYRIRKKKGIYRQRFADWVVRPNCVPHLLINWFDLVFYVALV